MSTSSIVISFLARILAVQHFFSCPQHQYFHTSFSVACILPLASESRADTSHTILETLNSAKSFPHVWISPSANPYIIYMFVVVNLNFCRADNIVVVKFHDKIKGKKNPSKFWKTIRAKAHGSRVVWHSVFLAHWCKGFYIHKSILSNQRAN